MAKAKTTAVVAHGAASTNPSYLEWGPVWAGALIAVAISTILIQFGTSVGLSMGEPMRADDTISYNFIIAGLWLLLVSIASSAAAGYVAGRMRMTMNDANIDEIEFRDGMHGIAAWALATVAVATVTAVTGAISAALAVAAAPETRELSSEMQIWAANQSVIIAFATAAGAALGAAAAWFAAVSGGTHRHEGTSHHMVVPALLRRK